MNGMHIFLDIDGTINRATDRDFQELGHKIVEYLKHNNYAAAKVYLVSGGLDEITWDFFSRISVIFHNLNLPIVPAHFASEISSEDKVSWIQYKIKKESLVYMPYEAKEAYIKFKIDRRTMSKDELYKYLSYFKKLKDKYFSSNLEWSEDSYFNLAELLYFDDDPHESALDSSLIKESNSMGVKYKCIVPKNNIKDVISFFEKDLVNSDNKRGNKKIRSYVWKRR
jgi:hypothetical protein